MDYALDTRTGEKVFPSEAIKHRPYLCPCCKKEVTVRSIDRFSQRTPHFAHLKGRADKNCENFFESISSYTSSEKKYLPFIPKYFENTLREQSNDGFSKGLYLVLDGKELKLYFCFHIRKNRHNWTGSVAIDALDGVKFFTENNISGKHDVQVHFNFSEENIKKIGNVDEGIWQFLFFDIPKIKEQIEFFHSPYSSGRMLGINEPLIQGEVYIVSSHLSLNEHQAIDKIIEERWHPKDSNFYQIKIPEYLSTNESDELQRILKRKILRNRPSFKLFDPLPILIEIDGTVQISNNEPLIVIGFDCEETEIDYKLLGGVSGYDQIKFNQNLMIIDTMNIRGVEIYWKKSLMIRIEKGDIQKFTIPQVTINFDSGSFNVLDTANFDLIPPNTSFYIDCPLPDVQKKISIGKGFNTLGNYVNEKLYLAENNMYIDAGSFGWVEFSSKESNSVTELSDHKLSTLGPTEKWLKTLSLLDGNIDSPLNLDLNGENISTVLKISQSHLRIAKIQRNFRGDGK